MSAQRHLDRACSERGAASTLILLTVSIVTLMIVFLWVLPMASVYEKSNRSSTAAQAAALAGAQQVRDDALAALPAVLAGTTSFGALLGTSHGQPAAADYADRNDATLINYSYALSSGKVVADVQQKEQVLDSGKHAESQAVAVVGVGLSSCAMSTRTVIVGYSTPSPTPTPTVTPSPTPTPTPTPAPIWQTQYSFGCSGFSTGWRASRASVQSDATTWLTAHLVPSLVD